MLPGHLFTRVGGLIALPRESLMALWVTSICEEKEVPEMLI